MSFAPPQTAGQHPGPIVKKQAMPKDIHSRPRVLVIGAGAMGLVVGYHLQMAGAEITFLVRPKRIEALSRAQILYSYDDATLKRLEGYALITQPAEAESRTYDYVIITIDGATSRSDEGASFLRKLGAAVRDTSAVVISGGVGFELRRYIVETFRVDDDRVLSGVLGNLAHQVASVDFPPHAPTDPGVLARAGIAYRHINPYGFMIEDRFPEPAVRFAALYDASGVSKCLVMNAEAFELMTLTIFPLFAGSELMGWPRAAALPDDTETWALTLAAGREVASLRLGDDVDEAGLAMTDGRRALQFMSAFEEDAMPLDLHAFNAFHHGGKVAVQDLMLLQDCIAAGQRQGKPMASLKELIARLGRARE